MDQSNPYRSPGSSEPSPTPDSPAKRPASPMVFGILSIVFAVFGLLGMVTNLVISNVDNDELYSQMGLNSTYMAWSMYIGYFSTLFMLILGIGLVRYRNWGRIGFNWYAVITIIWSVGQSSYLLVSAFWQEFDNPMFAVGAIGGLIGGMLGLSFPVLGLIFLNLRSVRDSLS